MRELTMPTGKALRDAVDALNVAMCHGKAWRISIPPDARDYDLLIHEMRNAHEAQERRIAELESQLALALPAQRFAGRMLDQRITPWWERGDEEVQEVGLASAMLGEAIRRTPCGEDCACVEYYGEDERAKCIRLTPAGEAALAAWRESQQEASDAR